MRAKTLKNLAVGMNRGVDLYEVVVKSRPWLRHKGGGGKKTYGRPRDVLKTRRNGKKGMRTISACLLHTKHTKHTKHTISSVRSFHLPPLLIA